MYMYIVKIQESPNGIANDTTRIVMADNIKKAAAIILREWGEPLSITLCSTDSTVRLVAQSNFDNEDYYVVN